MNARMLKILFLLAAVQFTVIVDFMIIMPLGPQLIRVFSTDTGGFSWIVSSYSLVGGISAVLASFYLDRFDRKKTFMMVYFLFLVGTYLCALSQTSTQLILARGFTGLSGGILGAQVYAIAGDLIPEEFRGRSTAIIMGSFSAASVIGVPIGLYLAQIGDWHFPFRVLVYVGILIFLGQHWILPKMTSHISPKGQEDPFEIYKHILSHKKLIKGLLIYPGLMFAHFSIIPFISPYLVFNVGYPEEDLFMVYMMGGLFTLVSSYIVGKWVDKTTAFHVYSRSALFAAIPILILTHMPPSSNLWALSITTLFFVLGSARFIPTVSALTNLIEPQYRGGYLSINSALQQTCAGMATQSAGFMIVSQADNTLVGYNYVGYMALVATVITLYIFSQIEKPIRAKVGESTQNLES